MLIGGAGAAEFGHGSEYDSALATFDTISGFRSAQGDELNAFSVDASVTVGGDQTSKFNGTPAFSGVPAESRS